MPADVVLVDSGPLVALLDPSDGARDACRLCLDALADSELVTTEAVVTEVAYLLAFSTRAQAALLQLIGAGKPRVEHLGTADWLRAASLIERYSSLPMDYADATLVVLAERLSVTKVFSLDRRDFGVYRVGRRRFQIIPEADRA